MLSRLNNTVRCPVSTTQATGCGVSGQDGVRKWEDEDNQARLCPEAYALQPAVALTL